MTKKLDKDQLSSGFRISELLKSRPTLRSTKLLQDAKMLSISSAATQLRENLPFGVMTETRSDVSLVSADVIRHHDDSWKDDEDDYDRDEEIIDELPDYAQDAFEKAFSDTETEANSKPAPLKFHEMTEEQKAKLAEDFAEQLKQASSRVISFRTPFA